MTQAFLMNQWLKMTQKHHDSKQTVEIYRDSFKSLKNRSEKPESLRSASAHAVDSMNQAKIHTKIAVHTVYMRVSALIHFYDSDPLSLRGERGVLVGQSLPLTPPLGELHAST
jgi:hypothetical protein